MATIALPRPMSTPHLRSASPRPIKATFNLETNSFSSGCSPIPNKNIPICPPGPVPTERPNTPPKSPVPSGAISPPPSLLYPPDKYNRYVSESVTLYEIDAAGVAAALDHIARQPIPDPLLVFPWLHGLHACNDVQKAFFNARRKYLRRTPRCLRGIAIVKAGGDLSRSKLKGALASEELLNYENGHPSFKDVDPPEGFSVRNFQIQAAKYAMVSDIIVYGDDAEGIQKTARDIAIAQQTWRDAHVESEWELPQYNTFTYIDSFSEFEARYSTVVASNPDGQQTGNSFDFCYQERLEMCTMTKASEVAHNVWMGPTPDSAVDPAVMGQDKFDVLIECGDLAQIDCLALHTLAESNADDSEDLPIRLEFPSSGSILTPTWSQTEADGILETCKWIYNLTHGIVLPSEELHPTNAESDSPMPSCSKPSRGVERKILIHCPDGYTESTLLALCYYTYVTGQSVPTAWLDLHVSKKRNFFAYPSDVALLNSIAPRLLSESPVNQDKSLLEITELAKDEPQWIKKMDGSLPSRITDYMYLGNLAHANNPDLLRHMGIGQILSIGETSSWLTGELEQFGEENVLAVQGVEDNGVDPLTDEIDRCLRFIDHGRSNQTATLVHCRVGVSRSATICIAEVMRTLHLSFPKAYCFVRARRLNVIIQPHLRFVYELLKWEEKVQKEQRGFFKRESEWPEIAREIAALNKPYTY